MTEPTIVASHARELRALLIPFITKRVAPQDVEDVLHDVFVRIQRGLADLRDTDKLVAWAYQVARNAIVDHARYSTIRQHDTLERVRTAAPVSDEDNSGAGELAVILGHFITMLPDPYRDALRLTELEGMTQAEAARRVGLSVPGMKSRVQRARVQLRELLEACCVIELDTRGTIIDVEPRNRPADLPDCCSRKSASSAIDARLLSMTNQTSPETKIETTDADKASSCCGGPAATGTDACCVKDAVAKAAGEAGCGCGPKAASAPKRCC
jgi:RNA polymerase sigma-70 factor, ECF subfamily